MKTLFALALISSASVARKRLVDKNGYTLKEARLVEDCTEKCFFRNDSNSWCIHFDTPMLQIGWTYNQEFDSEDFNSDGTTMNYFRLTLQPYVQVYFDMNSIYDIKNLFYQDLNVEFTKAKVSLDLYMIVNGDSDLCFGMGWENQALDLAVSQSMNFSECSKIFINNLGDGARHNIWYGEEAKWFQECTDSDLYTSNFTTWNFRPAVTKTIWYGTRYPDSQEYCRRFPQNIWPFTYIFTSSEGYDGSMLYGSGLENVLLTNFGHYIKRASQNIPRSYNLIGDLALQ